MAGTESESESESRARNLWRMARPVLRSNDSVILPISCRILLQRTVGTELRRFIANQPNHAASVSSLDLGRTSSETFQTGQSSHKDSYPATPLERLRATVSFSCVQCESSSRPNGSPSVPFRKALCFRRLESRSSFCGVQRSASGTDSALGWIVHSLAHLARSRSTFTESDRSGKEVVPRADLGKLRPWLMPRRGRGKVDGGGVASCISM